MARFEQQLKQAAAQPVQDGILDALHILVNLPGRGAVFRTIIAAQKTPLWRQLPALLTNVADVQGLVMAACLRGHIHAFMLAMQQPAAADMEPSAVARMIEALLRNCGKGACFKHTNNLENMLRALCQCQAAEYIETATALQLLQLAARSGHQNTVMGLIYTINSIPAVAQLSFEQLQPILQEGFDQGIHGNQIVYTLCKITPGIKQMPVSTLLQYLKTAVQRDFCEGATEALLCLPAAQDLSGSDIAALLELSLKGEYRTEPRSIAYHLMRLPGAAEVAAEAVVQLVEGIADARCKPTSAEPGAADATASAQATFKGGAEADSTASKIKKPPSMQRCLELLQAFCKWSDPTRISASQLARLLLAVIKLGGNENDLHKLKQLLQHLLELPVAAQLAAADAAAALEAAIQQDQPDYLSCMLQHMSTAVLQQVTAPQLETILLLALDHLGQTPLQLNYTGRGAAASITYKKELHAKAITAAMEQLCDLPAAQQLSNSATERLLLHVLRGKAADRTLRAAAVLLCSLPGAADMTAATVGELLLEAVTASEQHNARSLLVHSLCEVAAAEDVDSSVVAACLVAAVRVDCWGNMVQALCELPAASSVSASSVEACIWQLLRKPRVLTRAFPGCCKRNYEWIHAPVFELAAAQQLRPDVVAEMLAFAGQHSGEDCVQNLCALPGAKQLEESSALALLKQAVSGLVHSSSKWVHVQSGWVAVLEFMCSLDSVQQQLEAASVAELLQVAVQQELSIQHESSRAQFGTAVRALCALAAKLDAHTVSGLLQMAEQQGATVCCASLSKLTLAEATAGNVEQS